MQPQCRHPGPFVHTLWSGSGVHSTLVASVLEPTRAKMASGRGPVGITPVQGV